MVFTDLKVAEQFTSIFEDMAVADIRVALLWAARTGVQKTSHARPTYVREEQRETRRRRSESERAARPRDAR